MAQVVEKWTYCGRRLNSGKLAYYWVDADGNARVFGGKNLTKYATIGGEYEVKVEHKDGGGCTVFGEPTYLGMVDEQDPSWEAEDRAAGVLLVSRRDAQKDADNSELQRALDVIREHYQALRQWDRRSAFIAYVTEEMTMPPKARK